MKEFGGRVLTQVDYADGYDKRHRISFNFTREIYSLIYEKYEGGIIMNAVERRLLNIRILEGMAKYPAYAEKLGLKDVSHNTFDKEESENKQNNN